MELKQVFLSSTGKDLTEYREAVYRAIEGMDGFHCVRNLTTSTDDLVQPGPSMPGFPRKIVRNRNSAFASPTMRKLSCMIESVPLPVFVVAIACDRLLKCWIMPC